MITGLVHTHMLMALLTIALFLGQGVLALTAPRMLRTKPLLIGTHVIYTLLLLSAIALLVAYGWNPLDFGWILMKIALLIGFIVLGVLAFRPNLGKPVRVTAWFAGVGALLWAYSSALTKSVVPFL